MDIEDRGAALGGRFREPVRQPMRRVVRQAGPRQPTRLLGIIGCAIRGRDIVALGDRAFDQDAIAELKDRERGDG